MWPVVVFIELAIIALSGLEARATGAWWLGRWFRWHVAPFVGAALLAAAALAPAARSVARRAVIKHQHKQARILVERSPT